MNYAEINRLLMLHDCAYRLLMAMVRECVAEPEFLSPTVMRKLATRRGSREWLGENLGLVPRHGRGDEETLQALANLLWSFFDISFAVSNLQWDGKTIDTKIVLQRSVGRSGTRRVKIEATKRLLREYGIRARHDDLRESVTNPELSTEIALWTYVWELRQRSKGKSKGAVLRRVWRSMPSQIRRSIDADRVIAARSAIVNWGRALKEASRQ